MKELINIRSQRAFTEATKLIPGGVNSPVRAWKHLNATPIFIEKAKGPYLWDIDGNKYVDYCLSWGVSILGHAHPFVLREVRKAVKRGTSYGAPTLHETRLASIVNQRIPTIEKVRFVSSGTEAVMTAVRLARAFTGRNIIVKFNGCYHGHSDALLVKSGSGLGNIQESSSKGIPDEVVQYTVSLPFNDSASLTRFFEEKGNKVAAILLEIVPGNMGVIIPHQQFLEQIQQLAESYNCLIIADEVITGFRHRMVSAQQYYALKPDITTLGKIIGGGFPLGAVGGREEILELLAPEGPVYQAGTLSGNPVAVRAGIATLTWLSQPLELKKVFDNTVYFENNLRRLAEKYQFQYSVWGGMFSIFLTTKPVVNFHDVSQIPDYLFAEFHRQLLQRSVYISPSKYEANFISLAHSKKILDDTLNKIEDTIIKIYPYASHK
ncbi:MAG: glutamate-1-semialdehyde 2,1-aminomutase [Bacteroidales bacterium]|nr:glutamate-1-semialdehyde 2,1-aminomutase [Bacteroidales bacterium]